MRGAEVGTKSRLPFLAVLAAGWLLVQDILATAVGVQGAVTLGLAVVVALVLPSTFSRKLPAGSFGRRLEPPNPHRLMPPLALWAFIGFAGVLLLWNPNMAGLQNFIVWFMLPATIAVVAATSSSGTVRRLAPWWRFATFGAAFIYLAMVAVQGVGAAGFPYSDRGVGWVLLVGLTFLVPYTAINGLRRWPVLIVVVAIALSLSRSPLVASTLVLTFLALGPGRRAEKTRVVLAGLAVVVSVLVAFTQFSALRDRFELGDGYNVGGVTINSSGRNVLWSITIRSWETAPIFGQGPGSSQNVITRIFNGGIAHPHNEYLRILHDTGVVGLTLWLIGMLVLTIGAFRRYNRSQQPDDRVAHLSAGLALVVTLLGAITDNVTIVIFHTVIVGTLVGISLGRGVPRSDVADDSTRARPSVLALPRFPHEARHQSN